MALETWVFGAILVLVGLLVTGCSFGRIEFGGVFLLAGLVSVGLGSFVFVVNFKRWVDRL
jgi:hypothetical protein